MHRGHVYINFKLFRESIMTRENKQDDIIDYNGNPLRVDPTTGEAVQGCYAPLFPGDRIITAAQQEAYKQFKEAETKNILHRSTSKGIRTHFYFIPKTEDFKDLAPATVTRLIYLNTFARYDNRLQYSERRPIRRKDLPELLRVSYDTANRFWQEVSPKYIIEKDNGLMFSDDCIFVRGRINNQEHRSYSKMYNRAIRKLYESTKPNQHKSLGYFFQLLQFVNVEYNILCHDITETDIEKIEPITLSEFCELIGCSSKNIKRFFSACQEILFDVNGQKERFCSLVYDGIDKNMSRIFVNPNICYSGVHYSEVQILGKFCKV